MSLIIIWPRTNLKHKMHNLEISLEIANGPDTQPRVVPTPVTVIKQGTIIRYLVRKSENGTYREPGAQPMPLREALGYDGPDTPPRNVPTPPGHSPERVDWRGTGELYRLPTRPIVN